jgi:hypothetical protein
VAATAVEDAASLTFGIVPVSLVLSASGAASLTLLSVRTAQSGDPLARRATRLPHMEESE